MAGGGAVVQHPGDKVALYQGRCTAYVIMVAIVAASGGLLFGYDLGVTGGVVGMDGFLEDFWPDILVEKANPATNPYCKYDDVTLQLFTSSLFLAGMLASVVAAWVSKHKGRKPTMTLGGASFVIGSVLCAAAVNKPMLIIGRIFLGFGVGFANQAVPLYLSEIAPFNLRGALNIMFQLATTLGIVAAQLINYGTQHIYPWGWRLSLGLAIVPALILFAGSFILPETPNSLVERGHIDTARAVLVRVRGVTHVEAELDDIVAACQLSARVVGNPFKTLLRRKYRPQLVMAVAIPFFQQFTGINAIMFYAPQLFDSLGSSSSGALLSTLIIGCVNVVATAVAIFTVDKFGRKVLFLEGGIQMILAQITTAIVLGINFSGGSGNLDNATTVGVIFVICVFVAAFAWSWGPLGWLVPSEIQPLETRSAGFSITVFTNFLFSFVIGQAFLSMLCSMQYGVFLFFAGWCVIMTVFTQLLLVETKGVPIEEMFEMRWKQHKVWGPIIRSDRMEPTVELGDVPKGYVASEGSPQHGTYNKRDSDDMMASRVAPK